MKRYLLISASLLAASFLTPSCTDQDRAARTDYAYTYYDPKDYSYDQRDGFRADMERAIEKLELRAEELRARAASAGRELKQDFDALVDEVEAEIPELRRKLAEAGAATREGWEDFQRGFRETFDDLGRRINEAFD